MIAEPGIYDDVSEADYHQDPCTTPSLSSSIAKLLVTRSPRHAWFNHARLNKAKALEVEKPTRAMDIGTAVHKTILGKGRLIKTINFDDYRKKEAQVARDQARAAGHVPILADDMASVETLATACKDQLIGTELAGIFDAGTAEATMVWNPAPGMWCRSRVDWLPAAAREGGHITLVDLKTTGGSAQPDDWQRTAYDMGYDIQDAFYRLGAAALLPGVLSTRFVFLVLEQDPPYGLSINEFGGQARYEAEELVVLALKMWAACLARDDWPGYPPESTHIDPPKWRSDRAEIRRLATLRRLEAWQAPHAIEGRKVA